MLENELPSAPRELVRRFRQTYVNAHALRERGQPLPHGAQLTTPRETPIREADLPHGVRSLLADYRRDHPGSKLALLKYQRLENGKPVRIVEDDSDLPDEDALLSLTQTVTLTTSTEVRVITEIVVASVTLR